ncbi:MAG: CYTH domain-containing protein [Trebonia sp.]
MADHLEIERKFDVDAGFQRPDFAGVAPGVTAAAPVVHHLSATYFDTADGRLAAGKITLRRRTGGADEGWHLKLPGGAASAEGYSSRQEVQLPLDAGGERDVPAAQAARVAEVTGGLPLAPIATLDTERTVVTLTGTDGALLAEIADDRVTASRIPSSGQPLRWREVEVEVPSESPAIQQAVAARLFAAGARPAGHGSKLARLLSS